MMFRTILFALFVTIHTQHSPTSLNTFDSGSSQFSNGMLQGGVFRPEYGYNVVTHITRNTRGALSNPLGIDTFSSINTVNGVTTVTANIGGKRYSTQLPLIGIFYMSTNRTNFGGEQSEVVRITINGDTTVYTTKNGNTVVTDRDGRIRPDGGPFGVISMA
ncbi:hypothetical protein KIN20_001619 [Parelaphostrongylus tenuis]|uniref:Uncharacterized protein n=1 Tax=Parelaphostrongylus tenuis TaxID=148309 RepID=A0AAD5LUC0_PARTN|nr:hypothetical protein KIN20_001619 [Parelaphostrongylus tenuis]